jgi:pyridoxine 5-phosphate synthase
MKAAGVRTSVFVDPKTTTTQDYATLKTIGIDRVELFTERFADHYGKTDYKPILDSYVRAASDARAAGLGVNAGHDLSLENLAALIEAIPWIDEVSIGHALICDALYLGLEETVKRYLACIRKGTDAARDSAKR